MSLWDALSGTILHWNKLKEHSNKRIFHRLRGFDLRNLGLPVEAFEGLTAEQRRDLEVDIRGRLLAFLGSAQEVLDDFMFGEGDQARLEQMKKWGQPYKQKIKSLQPRDYTNVMFNFYIHFLIGQIDPEKGVAFPILVDMHAALYVFERPEEVIVNWLEIAGQGETWLNGINTKLSLEFASSLGLHELNPWERLTICNFTPPMIWEGMSAYLALPDWFERSETRIRTGFL
jgi:hypothetical protein